MRGSWKTAGSLALALLGLAALLATLLAACGQTTAKPAAPRKTPPPDAKTCADLTGFTSATSVPIADLQLPPGARVYFSLHPWAADSYALYEYHVCVPSSLKGSDIGDAAVTALLASGAWQAAQQFPADGQRLSACAAVSPATPSPTPGTPAPVEAAKPRCWSQAGGSYIRVDGVAQTGQLVSFRLVLARPPAVAKPTGPADTQICDPALYTTFQELQSIVITDGMQIPIPAGTGRGQSVWGNQDSGKGYNMPYIVTPMCTAGTSDSLVSFMKRSMPNYGWFQGSDDGLHWRIANPGGAVLYLTYISLDTPAHWVIALSYLQDGPPPVMPTPVPDGPNALCASVAGLEDAQPITLPGAQFPAGFVAAGTVTARGAYVVTDFLACAPDFELTAKPQNGSGGFPLYAMFFEGNWGYASSFPFDGTHLGACDTTAAGNYLKQWCATQGTNRYVEIERVSEPGKGLVVFHLLYATKP